MAFARRASYDQARADARPWLFGIATNLIRRHARREAQTLRAYARSGVDPIAPDDSAPRHDVGADVAAALAGLRPKHRDVLFLHAVAELTHEEIAEALDIPVGTARGWLHRARVNAMRELEARGVTRTPAPPDPEAKVAES